MTSSQQGRIVVLVSGSGTNLQALLDDADPAWSIVGVVSDRPNVGALDRAQSAGVDTAVVDWGAFSNRDEFTDAICDAVDAFRPDFIALAGFMRVLGASAIDRYPNRIVNVHPSLLPAFAGAHAVRDALAHGVKVTGVTVHFVDEQLDHGPIIAQRCVEVFAEDDEATLHSRIQLVEHELLPRVVAALVSGEVEVEGRHVKGGLSK